MEWTLSGRNQFEKVTDRYCAGEKRARPKSIGPTTDFLCNETDKGPPVQMHSLREFEQHLNDLKKENFSLKLRIYFLEERIQQKYEDSSEDVHKKNIELKVQVESLKKDLEERQELLSTAESLSNRNEADLQHRLAERQDEISHMQEILETKVQRLQQEAQIARDEADRMAALAGSESQRCLALEKEMAVRTEEWGSSQGLISRQGLAEKERVIEALTQEKSSLGQCVAELEVKVHDLSSSLLKKGFEAERLITEQQGQLGHYESAAGQCVAELQQAQKQVGSLQAKIRESEARNQKLQVRLGEMEMELRSVGEEAQRQERNIQNLMDTLNSKETEAAELHRVIEEQNNMLCSLKELVTTSQLEQLEVSRPGASGGPGELLALQASLFQAQLELQAGQRAHSQATRTRQDLTQALQRLEDDHQRALQRRTETGKHNQELQVALQDARDALQETQEQMRDREAQTQQELQETHRTIRELRSSLQTKEHLLQDYSELLEQQQAPGENRGPLLETLRQRIKDRDRALERAVDERFRCVEEKEVETLRLQLLLREKERDLEIQRCVLSNNQETITALEVVLCGRSVQRDQQAEALRRAQQHLQESQERHAAGLRERDGLIRQLQEALHTRTQEAQDLRSSLLGQLQGAPKDVLEGLRARLQLKDRLFQEVMSDRTRQAQEHEAQIQDLLDTISARDQYIQDSAGQLGEVMKEQAARRQELRRQLTSGSGSGPRSGPDPMVEVRALQEELRLALRREKEAGQERRAQEDRLDSLTRALGAKDDIIRGFQRQLVEPSGLSLVERLTQEVQELRESLVQQDLALPPDPGPVPGRNMQSNRQPEFGELNSEDEDGEEEDDDCNSGYTYSVDEDESKLTARSLASMTSHREAQGGLLEVKQLVEQKRAVERELAELKAQLDKAGFSSLSQMRKALLGLCAENEALQQQLKDRGHLSIIELETAQWPQENEEQLPRTIEEDESSELWDAWEDEELRLSQARALDQQGKRRDPQPVGLALGAVVSHSPQDDDLKNGCPATPQQKVVATVMCEKTKRLQKESKELQEKLMVSEATVQAQAEQLKDYRELLTETSVQQDSKQIQVDLQDLGYETCGRSENEAEREEASSPEFDDLEMCTSLECGSQWWPANKSPSQTAGQGHEGQEDSSLQRLVEDLRSQLSRSQGVIRGLQSRLRSLSTASDCGAATPARKVNWCSQSGAEDDEGWQSSDGGAAGRPDLQELVSRVGALEEQMKNGAQMSDSKATTWPGRFDTLIQAQARELSHLRQRLGEARGACHMLSQHLGDTTKAFEELLRANDIDYYMGQSFREQLAQGSALAQRLSAKISGREHTEDPDDKTELLAIRLSKELQQKDKVIECLRAKLNRAHHHLGSDTPCSSRALSDTTDLSDRHSFASDERGSTHGDLELCSDMDGASEPSTRVSSDGRPRCGTMSPHTSVPPSITSHCPSMQRCPHKAASSNHSQTGLSPPHASCFPAAPLASTSTPRLPPVSFNQGLPLPFDPCAATRRPCYQDNGNLGFSLAEVQQELQQLQRQLGVSERFSMPPARPIQDHGYLPPPYHGLMSSPFAAATKTGRSSLLDCTALWDMDYGEQPMRAGADLSSGSSGYQSGTSHTGSHLMKEHLREIRTLRQRLEDSIQTNDRLRRQLEDRLAITASENGAPTNIYIQGVDSMDQLSGEIRLLKKENLGLQNRLQQASQDGSEEEERLQEAVLLGGARLKEAESEAAKWAGQSRRWQAEAQSVSQEVTQLKQERQRSQETINRLEHELSVLQQQCREAQAQAQQYGLQMYQPSHQPGQSGEGAVTFDPRGLHLDLPQWHSVSQPHARRQLFSDSVPAPPTRDAGLFRPPPASPAQDEADEADFTGCGEDHDEDHAVHRHTPHGTSRHGGHALALVEDLRALQQQILEGTALVHQMEVTLSSLESPVLLELGVHQRLDKLLCNARKLREILEEASSLLRMLWRAALPTAEVCQSTKQEQSLKEEIISLSGRLSEQEEALKDSMERLSTSNRTKDSMEQFIISQLSRTRDVLEKAKTNLQVKRQEVSVSSPSLLVGLS